MRVGIIERAYQLAQTGDFVTVLELERHLSREGYESVHMHLSGSQIRGQLKAKILEAKA